MHMHYQRFMDGFFSPIKTIYFETACLLLLKYIIRILRYYNNIIKLWCFEHQTNDKLMYLWFQFTGIISRRILKVIHRAISNVYACL